MQALPHGPIVLASRSPRRLELLRLLLPRDEIIVCPPQSSLEAGFTGLDSLPAIEQRLAEVARAKLDDVCAQQRGSTTPRLVLAADTEIIVTDRAGQSRALGQPDPAGDWRAQVRAWFTTHYAGQTHRAVTAVAARFASGRTVAARCTTRVTMRADLADDLDGYLDSGEPLGKAGGYALQGLASIFIERVEGSLSNVIGLPLELVGPLLSSVDHHEGARADVVSR